MEIPPDLRLAIQTTLDMQDPSFPTSGNDAVRQVVLDGSPLVDGEAKQWIEHQGPLQEQAASLVDRLNAVAKPPTPEMIARESVAFPPFCTQSWYMELFLFPWSETLAAAIESGEAWLASRQPVVDGVTEVATPAD